MSKKSKPKLMEASKPVRTLDQIRKEYTDLCAQLGQLYYQLNSGQKNADQINNRLSELNQEAAPLVEQERKNAQTQQPN